MTSARQCAHWNALSTTNAICSITPENAQKWESTEPSRGNFTFTDADRYVKYAKDNGLQIHCHNLVWHSQLPAWVTDGKFDNQTLIQIMEDHIKALAGRYNGECTRWDVVNEGEIAPSPNAESYANCTKQP